MMRKRKFGAWVCLATLFLMAGLSLSTVVYAGEDAAAGDAPAATANAGDAPAEEDKKLPEGPIQMVLASGFIGYIIVLMSVVTVALCIENLIAIKREKLLPEDVLADIEGALDNEEYEEALEICNAEDCLMTRVLAAGLSRMAAGIERMEDAMAEEAGAQSTMLHQKLGYINLIAGTGPMMGLLGTVSGMIGAFGQIAASPTANAQDLAGGIYVALMTTLLGLIVAIPATIAFTFFRGRVVKIQMALGIITSEVLDRFRMFEEE